MKKPRAGLMVLVLGGSLAGGLAFNGHHVSEGPLTVVIGQIPEVTNHQPQKVSVTLSNSSSADLAVELELGGLVDECRAAGATRRNVTVKAGGAAEAAFEFVAGQGTHSALYPVHVEVSFAEAGHRRAARAIQVFQTDFSALQVARFPSSELRAFTVPASGVLALAGGVDSRAAWQIFGREGVTRSATRWQGTDERTGTTYFRGPVARGVTRQALQVHPPWRAGAGTMFVEYRLRLPQATPIAFECFNAIRDHTATEPPSDGMTFRVWVEDKVVLERHTDSKAWVFGRASLDEWAGREVTLKLEAHPGPKGDTTCDSGYWGDPVVRAGTPPRQLTENERTKLNARARAALAGAQEGAFHFDLGDGAAAGIVPGPNGIVDGAIAFGKGNATVVFGGFAVAVLGQPVGGAAGLVVEKVTADVDAGGRLRMVHQVQLPAAETEGSAASGASYPQDGRVGTPTSGQLKAEVWAERGGLRLRLSSDARISDLAIGRADQLAPAVYYGHGYCLVEPGKFRAGGGGHNLATSHVGFDFAGGLSLVMACDTPPDDFQVDPEARVYALHTHPDTTFSFVAGTNGAMECAVRYRPLYDKQAAPALDRKAGRFVFDIWGGRYAEDARLLRRCFDYGLTNSLALMHVWQRWGYDYRLPDIFPPLPSLGTLDDLRELGRTCDEAGALWGLHDNYIDIYPDATGFSYEHVTFDAEGRPRKAWLNEGRNAQSYQFRPDSVQPFLERNLRLIAPALKPSASFVDVWTSINAFDYHDRQGRLHSKLETLRCWGENFGRIRDAFAGGPTTSEAGSDQLIGWLEGADCQFLQIGQGRFNNSIPCRDWARVPWFDLVNHARFSLHGVGYSDRYQGGRGREEHGIESDDYLSAEMLTGHALMIDLPGMVRGAVRKYWLAQDFIESVALDSIRGVDIFTPGREPLLAPLPGADSEAPHRLRVRWESGAEVWVNRGTNDWHVGGKVLPPFGFFARNGGIEASVERLDGEVVERSSAPGRLYINGRGFRPHAPLAIRPEAREVQHLDGRSFRLVVDWHAEEPAPKDLAVFYHFSREVPGRYTDAEFYGGGVPTVPTSTWNGRMETGTNWVVRVPEGMPLGEYDVLVGLYDARGDHRRYRLSGREAADRRYLLGRLVVEGSVANGATNVTGVRFAREAGARQARMVTGTPRKGAPVNFGMAETTGGVRLVPNNQGVTVLPLPDGDAFELRLRLAALPGRPAGVRGVHAIDTKGTKARESRYAVESGVVRFQCEPGVFGYRVEW